MISQRYPKTECLLRRLLGLFPRIFLKTFSVDFLKTILVEVCGSGGSTIDFSDCISFVWLCWDGVEGCGCFWSVPWEKSCRVTTCLRFGVWIGRNCAKWFIVSTKCKWMLNPAGLEMTYRFNRAEVTEARSWCVPGAACTAALYYPVWGAQGMCSGWCVGAVWIMFGAEDLCIIAYGRGNIW